MKKATIDLYTYEKLEYSASIRADHEIRHRAKTLEDSVEENVEKEISRLLRPHLVKSGLILNHEVSTVTIEYQGLDESFVDITREEDFNVFSFYDANRDEKLKPLLEIAGGWCLPISIRCWAGLDGKNPDVRVEPLNKYTRPLKKLIRDALRQATKAAWPEIQRYMKEVEARQDSAQPLLFLKNGQIWNDIAQSHGIDYTVSEE